MQKGGSGEERFNSPPIASSNNWVIQTRRRKCPDRIDHWEKERDIRPKTKMLVHEIQHSGIFEGSDEKEP